MVINRLEDYLGTQCIDGDNNWLLEGLLIHLVGQYMRCWTHTFLF